MTPGYLPYLLWLGSKRREIGSFGINPSAPCSFIPMKPRAGFTGHLEKFATSEYGNRNLYRDYPTIFGWGWE